MDERKPLTRFLTNPASGPDLTTLLDRAGLELWQAPEGFWAIRLKAPAAPDPSSAEARRPFRRTR